METTDIKRTGLKYGPARA